MPHYILEASTICHGPDRAHIDESIKETCRSSLITTGGLGALGWSVDGCIFQKEIDFFTGDVGASEAELITAVQGCLAPGGAGHDAGIASLSVYFTCSKVVVL